MSEIVICQHLLTSSFDMDTQFRKGEEILDSNSLPPSSQDINYQNALKLHAKNLPCILQSHCNSLIGSNEADQTKLLVNLLFEKLNYCINELYRILE